MKQSPQHHRGGRGFTIVELLIVIVIIAILATITAVSYNIITTRAKISAIASDLTGAYTQLAADNLNNGGYPASATAANGGQGLKATSGVVLQYTKDATTNRYCLSGTTGSLVYHVDSGNKDVILGPCTTTQGLVTTMAGSGAQSFANGTGAAASFYYPYQVVIDSSGNFYIADTFNNRIRKMTPAGVVTTFAGSGVAGAANGTGTAASFNKPTGVGVDANGNLYVADLDNHLIRKVTSTGVVTTVAGTGSAGAANGTGTAASFNKPYQIAVDASGTVYVADTYNMRIRKVTSAGVVTTLAGSGAIGAADGTGTAATFNYPRGISIDASGNLFIADTNNHKIRRVSSAGVVTTLAGSGMAGATNGTGSAATFSTPAATAVDGDDNVYVADTSNSLIRKVTSTGVVTTLAGTGVIGAANGSSATATFNTPAGITIDASGNVYVADTINNLIRKISI